MFTSSMSGIFVSNDGMSERNIKSAIKNRNVAQRQKSRSGCSAVIGGSGKCKHDVRAAEISCINCVIVQPKQTARKGQPPPFEDNE